MSLQTELQSRLKAHDTPTLLRQLGYAPGNQKALARLLITVEDDFYGLDQSRFDFRYSGADFLRALARQLDIAPEWVEAEIRRVQNALKAQATAFKPYLWVDTHFQRQSQPLFALAVCENQRYLPLDWRLPQASEEKQLAELRKLIAEHWQHTQGDLGIWGRIQCYWYCYAEGQYWRFSPDGEWLDEYTGPVTSRASLRV